MEFTTISKEKFKDWLAQYPRKLERDVYGACEPPLVTYNDFERAPYWPDSIVASHALDAADTVRVLADINAPVPDDGERDTDEPLLDKNLRQVKEGDRIRAHWGGSFSPETGHVDHYREHRVVIRDKGTKYEAWSLDDCHNRLRGFYFEILPG